MTESNPTTPEDAAAARAAEQARIRKERREAKIRAGGSARLNKITGLGGGIQRDPPSTPPSQPQPTSEAAGDSAAGTPQHADPDEVDISQHYYTPRATSRSPAAATPPLDQSNITEAQMREMMLGFERPGANPFFDPAMGGATGGAGAEEDPMMKLLSQMMSGAGGGPGGAGGPFGAGNPFAQAGAFGAAPGQPAAPATPDRYASIWRLVHFVIALGLGLYIAVFTTFSGTKIERERAAFESTTAGIRHEDEDSVRRYFFWAFATAETVLLTSRFFLDRGRAPPSGMLWTIAGFLPEPFKGYLGIGLRYSQIFSTVRSDMLVCVFVLGVCHLLRAT
ncbi:putative sad1 interacting factor 1 protein [Phaeoacremonium minimum UCRPA7]|uniref:Putative sad1 interacting factor 1 protein n=1 Tax=Phaeoacremonium minimum (strain UCR-PA7) TaxID=1286976 RepID=R8BLY9_PHAM7|nr:putative sad1 interacting factor 1 protein [Phaeoacremonium minimum UCRPA7]EOO00396.1 putative sad1 interacting factor 1 protein [Phaeoacremonium minimum UCRPA7]